MTETKSRRYQNLYEEGRKVAFIRDVASTLHLEEQAFNLFRGTAKYEKFWNADVCTKTAEELKPMVEGMVGTRIRSSYTKLLLLRRYCEWCIAHGVPGAVNGIADIQEPGIENMRSKMVRDPLHLQKCLNEIFLSEDFEAVDTIYRAYFWLSFACMPEQEILQAKNDELSKDGSVITHDGVSYYIPSEGWRAVLDAAKLTQLMFKQAGSDKTLRRSGGVLLLRTVKNRQPSKYMVKTINGRVAEAIENGAATKRLSHKRVFYSGLFYSMYVQECAGLEPDFREFAIRQTARGEYNDARGVEVVQKRIASDCLNDYKRWKLAFGL